jgi:hypothetical protein
LKNVFIILLSMTAWADSAAIRSKADEAEIRENTKRNATYRKLAADTRVALAKQGAFYSSWAKDCESKGLVLSLVVPGDGRLDCVAKPPAPPPAEEKKKP